MNNAYSSLPARWLPRPLAALGLLLATAGATHAQRGALVNAAPQADASRPAAQARPMSTAVTTYLPVSTTAQARQQAQAAAAVATTTVTFANTQQGWFSPQNGHDATNSNYIVGSYERVNGRGTFRNFFTFSLTNLNLTGKQVVSATLSLVDGGSAAPNSTVTYNLYDVSTPTTTLGTTYATGDPAVVSVFNDLGTGKSYGSFVNTAASTGRRVYTLAAPALADIAARAGQNFSLGGMLLEEQATVDTYLFGATGIGNSITGQQILTLELADAQAITTGAVSTAVCAGASLSVPFTAAGTFATGNVFTAQLSDAAGSFAAPTTIGTLASTSSGTIAATVPAATAAGSGYRVRVVSSNPAVTGTDNGSAIVITALPTLTMLSPATGPAGTQVMLTGTNLTGATAVRFNGTAASSFVVNSATSITAVVPATATTGPVSVTTPCGTATSATSFVVRVAPTTVADAYTTQQGVLLTGNVLTNDIGTNPRAILINRPTRGTLVLNPDGSFTYQPNATYSGSDSFTYYACDPAEPLLCGNPVTVSITILNSPPTITMLSPATGPVGTQVTISGTNFTTATAVRFNGTAASSFVVNSATSITAVVAAGTTTGLVSVTTLTGTATSTNNFVVRVPPTTVADAYTTQMGVLLTGNVLTNDIGTNPRAILINRPTRGTLVLNPDGSFTYQPNAGYTGSDSFTYYACDPAEPLLCGNPATVSITIVNTPAVVSALYRTGDLGQPTDFQVQPYLQLVNNGTTAVPYQQLTVRYWLTPENFMGQLVTPVDWVKLGTGLVSARYVQLATPRQGAFGYIEYSFSAAAGNLAAGTNSGDIYGKAYKPDYSNFNETDDWSYQTSSSFTTNSHVTVYQNGTLIDGNEPPAVASTTSIRVLAGNQDIAASTSYINVTLQVANTGTRPVNYSDLTARYYFTRDGATTIVPTVDYAKLGASNISVRYVPLTTPLNGADGYLEIGFSAALGVFYPLTNTDNIQFKIRKGDFTAFTQTNDYSFSPSSAVVQQPRVPAYLNGALVFGTEPSSVATRTAAASKTSEPSATAAAAAATSATEAGSEPLALALTGSPNPFGDQLRLQFALPTAQAYTLAVYDVQGRLVQQLASGQAEAGQAQQVEVPTQAYASGLYLVRLTTATSTQLLKLLKQ